MVGSIGLAQDRADWVGTITRLVLPYLAIQSTLESVHTHAHTHTPNDDKNTNKINTNIIVSLTNKARRWIDRFVSRLIDLITKTNGRKKE